MQLLKEIEGRVPKLLDRNRVGDANYENETDQKDAQ